MSNNKHTPGQWKAELLPKECNIYSKSDGGIARIMHEGKHKEEHEANANLIAAAPDMLEALKRIRTVADVVHPSETQKNIIAWADEAISKAEGK